LKEGIHPAYNETVVVCACGEKFTTRSTRQQIQVDICSRVEKFKRKYAKAEAARTKK
jgi:large subunit ribosomal protein L31